MEKIFHWTNTFKTLGEDEDGSVNIKGLASTNAVDRAGDVINHDAWIQKNGLENYKTNPIVLFNHDYNKPIGRATSLEVTENGLEFGAKISKSSGEIKDLIKDGVLGAFSVGFRVKDADYNSETDGYTIKDAELFEVSVVSVPCNQGAMFSVSKSFDSMDEYNDWKTLFNNNEAQNISAPQAEGKTSQQETNMSNDTKTPEANIDLKAFAEDVANKTAARIAMQQAETKAKELADADEKTAQLNVETAEKEAKQDEVKTIVEVGMAGAEKLMNDVEKRVSEKHDDLEAIVNELQTELKDKKSLEEIILIKVPNKVYPEIRGLFILLFEKSGFNNIKIEESIDFKELYLKRSIQ